MSKKSGKSRKPQPRTPANRPAVPPSRPANTSTQRTPEQAKSNASLILLAGFGAAVLLFWYYHLLVLVQMTDLSGGLAMPDQLVGGYDVAHIESLRAAMDGNAVGQLNYVHKTAGLLFPLFLSLMTMLAVNLYVPRGAVRWGLWAVPMLFAVVDLWENSAIDALFTGAVDPAAVALASTLTVARWILLLGTVAIAVVVLVRAFLATFRQKRADTGLS